MGLQWNAVFDDGALNGGILRVSIQSTEQVVNETQCNGPMGSLMEPEDKALDSFMVQVGRRVRDLRAQRGWSGRRLSEISGVSLRYLSLLENGKGNASTAVLFKLARALECPIEQLVSDDVSGTAANVHLLNQFETSPPDVQLQVCEILNAAGRTSDKEGRLCLIGLSGAGKSSLGRLLSERTGVQFLELEDQIEKLSGLSIGEVRNQFGLDGYRKLERQALETVVMEHRAIIMAVPADLVSSADVYRLLLRKFTCIWLKATPEEHINRTKAQAGAEAQVSYASAIGELRAILSHREALYANADQMLNTSGRSIVQSLQELHDATLRLFSRQ